MSPSVYLKMLKRGHVGVGWLTIVDHGSNSKPIINKILVPGRLETTRSHFPSMGIGFVAAAQRADRIPPLWQSD
jgi:hypothetical protein